MVYSKPTKNLQWQLPQFLSDHKAIIMFFQTNKKGAPGPSPKSCRLEKQLNMLHQNAKD